MSKSTRQQGLAQKLTRMRGSRDFWLAEHISSLASNGLPLADGLEAYSQDLKPELRLPFEEVVNKMRNGLTLADAVSEKPKLFRPRFSSMIRAGEQTGTLAETMKVYSAQVHFGEMYLRRAFEMAMYSLSTTVVQLSILSELTIKTLPLFKQLWLDVGYQPGVLAASRASTYCVGLICLLIALASILTLHLSGVVWARKIKGPDHSLRAKLSSFLAGSGEKMCSVAAFCETLSVLLKAGVATPRAVMLAADVGAVGRTDDAMQRVSAAVAEGGRLSAAINRELKLRGSDAWVLSSADGSELLPDSLSQIAGRHLDKAGKRNVAILTVLLALLVLCQGFAVLTVGLSVLGPLLQFMEAIGP